MLDPLLPNGEEQQPAELESPSPFLISAANSSLGSLRVQRSLFLLDGWPEGTQGLQVRTASEILLAWKDPALELNLETERCSEARELTQNC